MSWLKTLFADIGRVFSSPKLKAVESSIAALVPAALPIVEDIAALTPNRTVQEITKAYEKYAVPASAKIQSDPATALRDLAASVLQKNHAPDAATGLLNTVVELAVQGVKAAQGS